MGLANLVLGAPSQPEERQGAQKMIICCDVKPKKPSDFETCRPVLPGSCDGYVAGRSGKRQTYAQTTVENRRFDQCVLDWTNQGKSRLP